MVHSGHSDVFISERKVYFVILNVKIKLDLWKQFIHCFIQSSLEIGNVILALEYLQFLIPDNKSNENK